MFRKILLKSGLLAVIGVAMIGMMSFAKPKDSVCFSAGAEGVMDATATAPTVQKAIEDASNRSIDAGVASVLEQMRLRHGSAPEEKFHLKELMGKRQK